MCSYFSWSEANQDNWVTNTSACPTPLYTNCGNDDGFLFATQTPPGNLSSSQYPQGNLSQPRVPVDAYVAPNGKQHALVASAAGRALCQKLGEYVGIPQTPTLVSTKSKAHTGVAHAYFESASLAILCRQLYGINFPAGLEIL